jgi:uncharacterized protein (DUF433 family)
MIDWSACALVQTDAAYQSGAPTLRADPRMTVETLVGCAEYGMPASEIAETYDVPVETVRALLNYAATHRAPATTPDH